METSTTYGSHLVTGVFRDKNSADRAYNALNDRGYTRDQIHLMMSEDTKKRHYTQEAVKTKVGSNAIEGLGTGSAIGGTLGAIAAVAVGIGSSILLPGLGLVIAGPLVAGLAGAGAGGIAGGIVGVLIGTGIPKERAVIYEKGINEGHIVLGVNARNSDEIADIEKELRAHDAYEVHS